ncbi:MAG TPA: alpha/beta fold hydrolase [Bacteroidota bacterium]|nr:alpha/beta fold hydrolase [Bacteroidota bacterium]
MPALIILHGLFGSSDNWHSLGKIFGEQFYTLIPDARNHGRSPHQDEFNYQVMANDVVEFIHQQHCASVFLIGHSMGGKTAMLTALQNPELIDKLLIADMALRAYPPEHEKIFEALHAIDLSVMVRRIDIETKLAQFIFDEPTLQLLMKNLARDEQGKFRWKMNLPVLQKNYKHIIGELSSQGLVFDKPALFLRGEHSEYILLEDLMPIAAVFPRAELITIKNAAHWVHADAPDDFAQTAAEFLLA